MREDTAKDFVGADDRSQTRRWRAAGYECGDSGGEGEGGLQIRSFVTRSNLR